MPGAGFLDVGCGSGILSLAAAKLGLVPVAAFDCDPDAVACARENLARNHVTGVACAVGDLAEFPLRPAWRLVAANLESPILLAHAARLAALLDSAPDSRLLISGVLTPEYPRVLAEFAAHGLAEADRTVIAEWSTGCLRRA